MGFNTTYQLISEYLEINILLVPYIHMSINFCWSIQEPLISTISWYGAHDFKIFPIEIFQNWFELKEKGTFLIWIHLLFFIKMEEYFSIHYCLNTFDNKPQYVQSLKINISLNFLLKILIRTSSMAGYCTIFGCDSDYYSSCIYLHPNQRFWFFHFFLVKFNRIYIDFFISILS